MKKTVYSATSTGIRLLENPRDFPDPGQERAWVIRLGVNACKNWRRSAWLQQTRRRRDHRRPAQPPAQAMGPAVRLQTPAGGQAGGQDDYYVYLGMELEAPEGTVLDAPDYRFARPAPPRRSRRSGPGGRSPPG